MSQNDDTESCSASSIGLPPLSLGKPRFPHSQTWTLVDQYNMEMRQQLELDPFLNWKYDVQCQIANISNSIKKTFEDHPDLKPGNNAPITNTDLIVHPDALENVRRPTYKKEHNSQKAPVKGLVVRDIVR
ncbi:hypothetical protein HOLleu_18140 [Holothuria leucospilota]|uniref:Uncharacterized protein n=1 Tax=Holothuria leucospilota TaxID=206669 RepID=A0A9Q1C328_HOLLE|nr:hypothetical protein HOLleu_18140 [Holothuria leucospilota]